VPLPYNVRMIHPCLPRRVWAILLVLVLAGTAVAGARFARQLCNEPLDVSGTVFIPSWVDAVKNQDALAYPAHVVLGTALARAHCRPSAIGLQWFKAASHARTESELRQAAQGMEAARVLETSEEEVRAELCRAVASGRIRPQQVTALEWAGLRCD
jgi:hypothetical protein